MYMEGMSSMRKKGSITTYKHEGNEFQNSHCYVGKGFHVPRTIVAICLAISYTIMHGSMVNSTDTISRIYKSSSSSSSSSLLQYTSLSLLPSWTDCCLVIAFKVARACPLLVVTFSKYDCNKL